MVSANPSLHTMTQLWATDHLAKGGVWEFDLATAKSSF